MSYQIVVFDEGKRRLMEILMRGDFQALDGHVRFHLFVNDVVLTTAHTLADLEEMSYSGYSPTLLSGVLEQGIDLVDSDTWIWPDVIYDLFTVDQGPTLAFGYYVTHTADGALLWAQNFDVPVVWGTLGDTYVFSPQISLGNCCPGLPPPAFSLCAVSSCLRGAAASDFSIDSVVQSVPFATFDVDSMLAETRGTDFDFYSFLAGQEQAGFELDAFLASEATETFAIDADLWNVPYPSTFISSAITRPGLMLFGIASVLGDQTLQTFEIDAALVSNDAAEFSIDSLVVAQPGVIFRGGGSGFITSPPGIHSLNVFIWGAGGAGGTAGVGHGGGGGGGGGYAAAWNRETVPGWDLYYFLASPGTGAFSTLYLYSSGIAAASGTPPASEAGGAGGYGIGGDFNARGGDGGDALLGAAPYYGAGGGSAGNFAGDGIGGEDATTTHPGLGGNWKAPWWYGAAGQNPYEGGIPDQGIPPGGGGGGGGTLDAFDPRVGSLGSTAWLYITYQAAFCWIDSVLKATTTEDFALDSFLADQATQTFSLDSFLGNEGTASFTVDTVLLLPGAETFQVSSSLLSTAETSFAMDSDLKQTVMAEMSLDACIADEISTGFALNAVVKLSSAKAFTTDASLKLVSTKTFTVDSDLKKTQTKTFTIDSDLKKTQTKTFTLNSDLKKSTTKTFTIDSDLASASVGYKLSFSSASSKWVNFSNLSAWNLSELPLSISCWFTVTDKTVKQGLVGSYSENAFVGGYQLYIKGDGKVYFRLNSGGDGTTVTEIGATINNNTLYHVVGTYDGSSAMKLYLNGSLAATGTFADTLSSSSQTMLAAAFLNSSGTRTFYLSGTLDAVRLYNTELTGVNVSQIYGSGAGLATAGSASANLIGWWKFDEGSGTTATDSSSGGHNGTLTNGPTYLSGSING